MCVPFQAYKAAFVDEGLWEALTSKLGELLKVDVAERAEDEQLVIERILILVRNVLQVPRDSRSEQRTDDDVSLHDQESYVLLFLHDLQSKDYFLMASRLGFIPYLVKTDE